MTWTYAGDPSATDRDYVRFAIGDTDSTDPLLTDEEIAGMVTEEGNKEAAALACAEALAAKFARLADKSVGDLSIRYSQRQTAYEKLAGRLQRKLSMRRATPLAGGISQARKITVEDDTDRVVPAFRRDQFSYPGTSADETESDDDELE